MKPIYNSKLTAEFKTSSGKRWYYKTLSVANSSSCLFYILTFRVLQKIFSAQQQQDLKIFNYKSLNGFYFAKLKKKKHQTGRCYVAARVFWFHWWSEKVFCDQTVRPVAPAKRHSLKLRKERKVFVGEAKNPRFFHRVASLFLRRSN